MKWALEWGGGKANGAEVNIGSFKTRFLAGTLDISNIQVTNPELPAKNTIQIDLIHFDISGDALLRAKLVVEDSRIEGIQLGAPRKKPGVVYPKPPPEPEKPGMVAKLSEKAISEVKAQAMQNPLAPIAQMAGQSGNPLEMIQGQLQSVVRAEALQNELKEKELAWKSRLQSLPNQEKLKELQAKAQAVEIPKDIKDTAKLQAALNQLKGIVEEGGSTVKQIADTGNALNGEMNQFKSSLAELEKLAKKDVDDLAAKAKLPSLDPKVIAQGMFADMIGQHLAKVQKIVNLSREYFPPKSEDNQPTKIVPKERSQGVTYQFGRPNSYPLFWLKKANISSRANPQAEMSGDVSGTLTDLTTDPASVGRPAVLRVAGNFPAQKISGAKGELIIDHTTSNPVETLNLQVDSFPVEGQQLTTTDPVRLGFENATGQTRFKAELKGQQISLNSNSVFSQIKYELKAQPDLVEKSLREILNGIPQVTLNAGITGSWTGLAFSFDSNLADEIRKGFEKQLQAKINEARGKIQEFVDKNLKSKKDDLAKGFATTQNSVQGDLSAKKAQAEGVQNVANSKIKEGENQGKNQVQQQGKEAVDALKKKFGF
jgi:uncharacterized protein (TIGR03545 family)